jgi:hypothetical protein
MNKTRIFLIEYSRPKVMLRRFTVMQLMVLRITTAMLIKAAKFVMVAIKSF